MSKLTDKQEHFCQQFLILGNKSEAYRAAFNTSNMKPATVNRAAKELYDNPKITARIKELQEERRERNQVDADYVLQRLIEIDQMDVLDILGNDGSFKQIHQWPKVWRQYISGLDISELWEGHGDDKEIAGLLKKIKWPDKTKNLELLGKHITVQAFKEQKELSGGLKISHEDALGELE